MAPSEAIGAWKGDGKTIDFTETINPDRTVLRVFTFGEVRTTENYAADGSGHGVVTVNSVQKATTAWGSDRKGNIVLGSGTAAYTPSRWFTPSVTAPSPAPAPVLTGTVTTLAGSTAGYKDATGAAAQFKRMCDMAVDAAGNVYVADTGNNRIRKISPDGVTTTLAGGTAGFANGQGAAARIRNPRGIILDASGNLYVVDTGNHAIRKVTPDGTVSTLAGSGGTGYVNGTGTAAMFQSPWNLTFGPGGHLYVADTGNNRIRQVTLAGVVTTYAGSGTAGYADGAFGNARFSAPRGIVADPEGNLYVSELDNHAIRKVGVDGLVRNVAGCGTTGDADGNGSAAKFHWPHDLAIDEGGNLYVADYNNHKIRRIDRDANVTTLVGSTAASTDGDFSTARFSLPIGLGFGPNRMLYVADFGNNRIRKIQL